MSSELVASTKGEEEQRRLHKNRGPVPKLTKKQIRNGMVGYTWIEEYGIYSADFESNAAAQAYAHRDLSDKDLTIRELMHEVDDLKSTLLTVLNYITTVGDNHEAHQECIEAMEELETDST